MTTRCVVRAALTEERSKAEISLGFAVSRRDQVLLRRRWLWGNVFRFAKQTAALVAEENLPLSEAKQ